jgi:hypothetical protein
LAAIPERFRSSYNPGGNGEGDMARSKPFTWIAAGLFALMALVHVVRIVTDFQLILGSHHIPMWVSYVAIVVTAFLSWMLCREARDAAPDQA